MQPATESNWSLKFSNLYSVCRHQISLFSPKLLFVENKVSDKILLLYSKLQRNYNFSSRAVKLEKHKIYSNPVECKDFGNKEGFITAECT